MGGVRIDLAQQLLGLLDGVDHHLGLAAFGRIIDALHLAQQPVDNGCAVRVVTRHFNHRIQATPLVLACARGRLYDSNTNRLVAAWPSDIPDIGAKRRWLQWIVPPGVHHDKNFSLVI
jgi:hypothetical protein